MGLTKGYAVSVSLGGFLMSAFTLKRSKYVFISADELGQGVNLPSEPG